MTNGDIQNAIDTLENAKLYVSHYGVENEKVRALDAAIKILMELPD